jgi:hypothetical protein
LKMATMVTKRRKLAGFLFGLVYGASLFNGYCRGLAFPTGNMGNADFSVYDWPKLLLAGYWVVVIVMGLLAGYVGRSTTSGTATSVVGAALFVAPRLISLDAFPSLMTNGQVVTTLAITSSAIGAVVALWSSQAPAFASDLNSGRVLNVSWKHWLWLWIPWEYMIINAFWLGTPHFIETGDRAGVINAIEQSGSSLAGACGVTYAGFRALQCIRADSPLTRWQAAVRFTLWFALVPVLVNLWRLFL